MVSVVIGLLKVSGRVAHYRHNSVRRRMFDTDPLLDPEHQLDPIHVYKKTNTNTFKYSILTDPITLILCNLHMCVCVCVRQTAIQIHEKVEGARPEVENSSRHTHVTRRSSRWCYLMAEALLERTPVRTGVTKRRVAATNCGN